MEQLEHSLYIVELFNKIFGKPILAVLGLLGIHPKNTQNPVPDYIVMCLIVAVVLALLLGLSARKLSRIPSKRQSILELIIEAFESLLVDIIGEPGQKYAPMIGTIGLFIFSANMLGLVPGFMSPTSNLKHFTGPIPALAPLLLPIEIISHFSRPVSLSLRLFGNIFAEELLIIIIASIVPFVLPLPFMAVAIFTAIIQAFVFVLLACIYIAGAVEQEEEH
jgi:F-type H+-transporting ATPase subunit a